MESDKRKQRLERFESVLLSIAILGTAWSAYQSACWRGIQTFRLTAAGVASRTALEKHLFTEQQFALDAMQVLHIVDQLVEGKSSIVEFYVKRIRPDVRAAVEAWLALKPLDNPNAPPHPLVMPDTPIGCSAPREQRCRSCGLNRITRSRWPRKRIRRRTDMFCSLYSSLRCCSLPESRASLTQGERGSCC